MKRRARERRALPADGEEPHQAPSLGLLVRQGRPGERWRIADEFFREQRRALIEEARSNSATTETRDGKVSRLGDQLGDEAANELGDRDTQLVTDKLLQLGRRQTHRASLRRGSLPRWTALFCLARRPPRNHFSANGKLAPRT